MIDVELFRLALVAGYLVLLAIIARPLRRYLARYGGLRHFWLILFVPGLSAFYSYIILAAEGVAKRRKADGRG